MFLMFFPPFWALKRSKKRRMILKNHQKPPLWWFWTKDHTLALQRRKIQYVSPQENFFTEAYPAKRAPKRSKRAREWRDMMCFWFPSIYLGKMSKKHGFEPKITLQRFKEEKFNMCRRWKTFLLDLTLKNLLFLVRNGLSIEELWCVSDFFHVYACYGYRGKRISLTPKAP